MKVAIVDIATHSNVKRFDFSANEKNEKMKKNEKKRSEEKKTGEM